ncbi:MAG TPA: UDP-N-acetylmuramoyl-tripeptide--D-alanyl-D-alanine ligase [Terriglobales bacterium]
MKLPLSRIAEFISAKGVVRGDVIAHGYSIDSRSIQPEELFFAVKGERMDGHDFVDQALGNGAVAAVVRRDQAERFAGNDCILLVDDTLVALQTLATAVRRLWGKKLIGITGSVGKTTTKDATTHLLSTRYGIHSSKGNFNNHFGLPLGLLKLEPEHEIAVVEMGMSHAGEIAALANIALPDEGVVTVVAPVHLEFFESLAGIARAKYELIASLPAGGTAFLNADDPYISQFGRDFHGKVVMFGLKATADARAENVELLGANGSRFELVAEGVRQTMTSPLLGKHNVYNVLAACAVALRHDITPSEIAEALPSLAPADKRGQIVQVGNVTVINDCYNSSPKALTAAVETLAAMESARRIVVAGEMLELGQSAADLHEECGRTMPAGKIDFVLGVRGLAKHIVTAAQANGVKAEFVETPEEAGDWLARNTRAGDVVLLKASRGVKLEKALERWKSSVVSH